MPYTNAYMTPLAYARVLDQFGSDEQFQYWLVNLVAEAVNLYTGEKLFPGHDSIFQSLAVDRTANVDLYVTILAWWKKLRSPHFGAIKRYVKDALTSKFPGLTIELELNRGRVPAEPPIDLSERIEDIFAGQQYEKLRRCVKRRGGVVLLGELLQLSRAFILRITDGDGFVLIQIEDKLDERGLALAPTHR